MAMALFALPLITALGVLHWALLGPQRQQTQTRAVSSESAMLAESEPGPGQGSFKQLSLPG